MYYKLIISYYLYIYICNYNLLQHINVKQYKCISYHLCVLLIYINGQ